MTIIISFILSFRCSFSVTLSCHIKTVAEKCIEGSTWKPVSRTTLEQLNSRWSVKASCGASISLKMWHAWHVHKDIKARAAYLSCTSVLRLIQDKAQLDCFGLFWLGSFPLQISTRSFIKGSASWILIFRPLNHIQHFLIWLNFVVIKC